MAYWCKTCKARRAKIDNFALNLVHEDMVPNLCCTYIVDNTPRGEKVMILDPGAPMNLARRPWLEKYLAEFDYKIKDMVSSKCYQVFNLEELTRDMLVLY